MDYAVSIVLSTIKAEVDKSNITNIYTTAEAIKRRLSVMPQSPENFILRYKAKQDADKVFTFNINDVAKIINDGYDIWSLEDKSAAEARQIDVANKNLSGKDYVKPYLTSLFYEDSISAVKSMHKFSFLTNSRSSELSKSHLKNPPRLDLGSIIYSSNKKYLLCLQASCDAVRGDGLFFFVPLVEDAKKPDIIIPHGSVNGEINYICLSVPPKCYTQSYSLNFGIIDDKTGHLPINYNEKLKGYYIHDTSNKKYRWLANLKYKRALRIAQDLSQQISRIGFDEFEPFRKNKNDK